MRPPGPAGGPEGGDLWRDRDFRTFMGGRVVTEVGSRITREGLPIVAILSAHATAPELGVMAAVSYLAVLALAPWAGVMADRRRRRPIMIVADLVRAALLATIPAAALLGALTYLQMLIVTGLVGGVGVFFDVADGAWLPEFVSRARLTEGNAAVTGASAVGETAGPALMGTLIQTLGGPAAIALDALSYVASAVSLLAIRRPDVERQPPAGPAEGTMASAVKGYRFVMAHPVLRPLALTGAAQSLFSGFFSALYEIYALLTLHQTPFMVGLLVTGGGVGALIGSLTVRWVTRRLGAGPVLLWSALVGGALNFLVPAAAGSIWLAFAALMGAQLLGDLVLTLFGVNVSVAQQALAPEAWLGRVNATGQFLGAVLGAAGALGSGLIAGSTGSRDLLWVAAAGMTVSGMFLWRSAAARLRDVEGTQEAVAAP